jgi:hypothetical protein
MRRKGSEGGENHSTADAASGSHPCQRGRAGPSRRLDIHRHTNNTEIMKKAKNIIEPKSMQTSEKRSKRRRSPKNQHPSQMVEHAPDEVASAAADEDSPPTLPHGPSSETMADTLRRVALLRRLSYGIQKTDESPRPESGYMEASSTQEVVASADRSPTSSNSHQLKAGARGIVSGWIKAGAALSEERAVLAYGEFSKRANDGDYTHSLRTVQKLMRIADHSVLSNPDNWSSLPPSLETLDQLARLSAEALEGLLAEGRVNSRTTTRQAKDLAAEARTFAMDALRSNCGNEPAMPATCEEEAPDQGQAQSADSHESERASGTATNDLPEAINEFSAALIHLVEVVLKENRKGGQDHD